MKSTSLTVLVLVLALFGTLACEGGGSVGTDAGETDDTTSDAVGDLNASILTLTIEGTEDEMGVMAQGGYEIATGAEEAVIVLVEEDQEQLPLYQLSLHLPDPTTAVAAWKTRGDLLDIPMGIKLMETSKSIGSDSID